MGGRAADSESAHRAHNGEGPHRLRHRERRQPILPEVQLREWQTRLSQLPDGMPQGTYYDPATNDDAGALGPVWRREPPPRLPGGNRADRTVARSEYFHSAFDEAGRHRWFIFPRW